MTAEHRPAKLRRKYRHDVYTCVDLFSGFGGLTQGVIAAGFTAILAANHNRYKVAVHEANHPEVEHWIADLADPESSDYHCAADLPAADLLVAGVTCTNHTIANAQRAYVQGLSLFDVDDPEWDQRATRSERDRATATCVLQYAGKHHPRLILIECTTELQSWGYAVAGKQKVGDGSTYRWWLKEFAKLGYRYRVLYLNSMFFGVPQSRDRLYICMWDAHLPTPDLDHRPAAWCIKCDHTVEAVWSWKTGVPPTGQVRYGAQYNYRCPACATEVVPGYTPSLYALDLSDLGTRIGDRKRPLAPSTLARAERCLRRFADFPAVLMPTKAARGIERHPWQPMATQTSQQETGLLYAGLTARVLPNRSNATSRSLGEPMETLVGSAGSGGLGVLSGVMPYRKNTTPTTHVEAMPTITAEQIPGLLTAAGRVQCNGAIDQAKYRAYSLEQPLGTVVGSAITQGMLFSGWWKSNGSTGIETAPHPVLDPFGAITARDTTTLLSAAAWRAALGDLRLEDCYFRMLFAHEVGRGCGFDVTHGTHQGTFQVWGSARNQVDGYGNAVSPPVGHWIGLRMRAALHGCQSTRETWTADE